MTRTTINTSSHTSLKLLVVVIAGVVGLNVLSAVILKMLADRQNPNLQILLLGVSVAVVLNGLRMIVWMVANKHFPLSTTYPLTSIFYPAMLIVSITFNESVNSYQWIGTILITVGVFWLGWRVKTHENIG